MVEDANISYDLSQWKTLITLRMRQSCLVHEENFENLRISEIGGRVRGSIHDMKKIGAANRQGEL